MIQLSFAISECGSVRDENQDACLCDPRLGIFAVADGLGGLPNGRRASESTLRVLASKLNREGMVDLLEAVHETNSEMRLMGFALDPVGFGSTLTVARFDAMAHRIQIAHVGDCAAILCRDSQLQVLTIEHTVANRLFSLGADGNDEIPFKAFHTLTQCIGQELYIDPQYLELPVQHGDRLFLMTDGVSKYLGESLLSEQLLRRDPIDRICQDITFMVERAGSPDNYSLVAAAFGESFG